MPAYRSSDEGDIRQAVVARLREARPGGRIIHEINVSTFGAVRMDLICVSEAEIIAVEIKSKKDKLDRLAKQVEAMRQCSHHVVAALHEKHLTEQLTNEWAAHEIRGDQFYLRREPDDASGAAVWAYPLRRRMLRPDGHDGLAAWGVPKQPFEVSLPSASLDLLWRDELQWLCGKLRVPASRGSRMNDMAAALRWRCNGAELTRGICAALRLRECVEADPVMLETAK